MATVTRSETLVLSSRIEERLRCGESFAAAGRGVF